MRGFIYTSSLKLGGVVWASWPHPYVLFVSSLFTVSIRPLAPELISLIRLLQYFLCSKVVTKAKTEYKPSRLYWIIVLKLVLQDKLHQVSIPEPLRKRFIEALWFPLGSVLFLFDDQAVVLSIAVAVVIAVFAVLNKITASFSSPADLIFETVNFEILSKYTYYFYVRVNWP